MTQQEKPIERISRLWWIAIITITVGYVAAALYLEVVPQLEIERIRRYQAWEVEKQNREMEKDLFKLGDRNATDEFMPAAPSP